LRWKGVFSSSQVEFILTVQVGNSGEGSNFGGGE
jgi:hypothetical protein